MADEPLPYAALGVTTASRARPRWRFWLIAAIGLLAFVPYPTLVCPSVKFSVVDQAGQPVPVSLLRWEGFANAGYKEGTVTFDGTTNASLPRQRVWASPFSRAFAVLASSLPHQGGIRPTLARLWVTVPDGYSLDPSAMGLQPVVPAPGEPVDCWRDPRTGDYISVGSASGTGVQTLGLVIDDPPRWGYSDYVVKVVMRRANAPAPAGPAPDPAGARRSER